MRIAFGTSAYQLRALPLSAQDMVNYYLEPAPPQSKALAACIPAYGCRTLATVGFGYGRGGTVVNGVLYAVYGETLYRINSDYSADALGTIPGVSYVDMAGDESNLMLVTDSTGWYWNGTTLAQVTDTDFPGAEWVEVLDGYYVIGAPDSGQFYVSANRNPASWDGLDFATAEKYPDDLVGAVVNGGELFLFGRESYEVWYNSGDADFTLARASNGFGEIGCLSRFGMVKADNGIFFLGHDGVIYRLNGYDPVRVSTAAIEQAIEEMADKTCFALTWNEGGHKFAGFSFDTATFVFDIATQLWHRRQSYGLARWRPLFIARVYDKWITGDFYSNVLGELSATTYQEFDQVLRGSVTSPPVGEDNRRIIHSRVELVFEQGVGLSTGQGSDPQVMLQFSDDGGRTWSTEKWRGLGRIGEYKRRAIWNRLGQARDRIYRFAVSDPVPRTLIFATTESAVGGY
jgi:hypothetical protein